MARTLKPAAAAVNSGMRRPGRAGKAPVRLDWSGQGFSDLVRLHELLLPVDPSAAARAMRSPTAAPPRPRR